MDFALERLHEGDRTRIVFDERNRSYTCGRGKENDILCLSLLVSRRHCIFFRDNENLYITDLRSSNGIYINGEARRSLQMIKLCENDIIGIGCPNTDLNNETLYNYKVCIMKSPILEEEETSTLSKTILNNNILERVSSVSPVDRVLGEKCASSSNCDMTVPNKRPKVIHSSEPGSSISLPKENANLSHGDQSPHNSISINNLVKNKHDTVDLNAEDDIQIIHTSLAKDIKKPDTIDCNIKSEKCSNDNNKSDFDEKMDISSIESNSDDDASDKNTSKNHTKRISDNVDKQNGALNFANGPNIVHTDGQTIKYEDELQITDDDEKAHVVAADCDKSPIKLKKIKHEPKTRFSIVDVVDLSDDEEGIFPYSQLFDIKFDDNTENKTEIKQKCVNDDEQNTEKIGVLNMDDEVIILTDSEDEDNPWLERLSRSQLLNEDIKPAVNDSVVKDEIDLGIWEDEITNTISSEIPCERPSTSQIPCSKEISSEISCERPSTSQILCSKEISSEIPCERPSEIPSTSQVPCSKEISSEIPCERPSEIPSISQVPCSKEISPELRTSVDDKIKNKKDNNTNIPTAEVNAMDVDEVGLPDESSSKDIDDKDKRTTDTKQHIEQTVSTESAEEKLIKKLKATITTSKRLIPVIEPLCLPVKKRTSRIDRSRDKAAKVREISESRLTTKEKKISDLKEKLNDDFYSKEQKHRKQRSKLVSDCRSPTETKPGPSISKDEKKMIIEKRKEKLKEIAAEEKKLSAGSNQDIKRRTAKPKAKVSMKNRGDFLVAEQESRVSKSLPDKSAELPKPNDNQPKKRLTDKANAVKKSTISNKRTQKSHQRTDDVSKDTINNVATSLQQSLHLNNISHVTPVESTLYSKANDDNKKKHSSSRDSTKRSNANVDATAKTLESRDRSIERAFTVQKENFSPNSLKSKLKSRTEGPKKKKTVSFSDKYDIMEYEIDQRNTLKKLVWKDAPIPTSKLPSAPAIKTADWSPKLEEFLLRIFTWNPVWLEEQRYLKRDPPIVAECELQAMRLSYDSYKQYYQVAMPLLLLEIWCAMTKDFEMIQKNMQRATMMCSIIENSITRTPIPSTNLFLTTLMLEVLVNKEDLNKQTHPIYGDLVYLEYVKNVRGKQIFHKIFAYVTNMHHMIITDFTHYNRDLRNYVKNPYTVITYTLLTRPLEHDIPINRVQRVRTVTYLRANIRMVQALQYLPQSPLLELIVNPKIESYQLPPLKEQYTSSSLVMKNDLNPKQLEAVFRVTDAVVKKEAKLCFIQGPPGTGKSKVIVNLVTQILYGEQQNKKSLRILVCAPSNAAIDEIVLRLLSIRSTLKQKRFNMVRIGRSESMHPMTKTISVTELARRHLEKMMKPEKTASSSGGLNEEDLAILEARINSLQIELAGTQEMHEAKRKDLMRRLLESSARYELLKCGKPIDELNSKDRAKYQRISENIILSGANIIACTLSSCYTNQMESIFGSHKERISVCIVDEATQSCEAETLIPLMLGVNTLVLVGDPNQLPATILSQQAKKLGLDQSVFSRMQNIFGSQPNSPIIMLDTQYRMDYAISYWPNKYFYRGRLKNAAECRTTFPFHSYRVLHHDFIQNDDKFSNTTEAEFVANIIFAMLMFAKWESAETTISLGVLTPYNNQRTLVLSKINEKISSVPDIIKKKINFEVNTVDSFQGQEKDIIIMSCVRSNGIGFLSDKQRLCVALTRAKHSLILCGNFCTFMKDQMWNALLADARCRGVLCHIDTNATPAVIKQFIVK